MRNDIDVEQELDNRAFALQRDLLMWRLARMHGLPHEEKRKRCLESLSKLHDLLIRVEILLTDGQEEEHQQQSKDGVDCVLKTT